MASPKQIEANRRNAQLSTGPTTEEGKAVVARNATTHGFYCRHLLLHGESDDDMLALRKSIYDSLRPIDPLETIYVERFVVAAWKLHRMVAAEPHHAQSRDDTYRGYCPGPAPRTHAYDYAFSWLETSANAMKLVAALERSMDKTVAELMKLRKNRIEADPAFELTPTEAPSNAIVENKPNLSAEVAPKAPEPAECAAAMTIDVVQPTPIAKNAETNPIQFDEHTEVENSKTNPIASNIERSDTPTAQQESPGAMPGAS